MTSLSLLSLLSTDAIDKAFQECRIIIVVVSEGYMKDGRRQYELNLAASSHDERNIPLVAVVFTEGSDIAARDYVRRKLGRRCPDDHVLTWSEDETEQQVFWHDLTQLIPQQ